ncbi:MAG: MFS transporter [Bradyrhizobium sp.]|nr:MFS transporter [Bradyrhizobium sp.]
MTQSGRAQGWFVLISGAVGVFMTTPGQTVGVSAFVDPIALDLGISRDQVVMLYSVGTLLGILPAPLIGRLVDRYGPRRAIAFIVPALGLACTAMAWAHGPWSLALAFTLLRGSAIGGLYLVSLNLVNLWFDRLRGRATAIAMLGLALGGLVIPGAAELVTAAHGWRVTYLVLGGAVVATMLPVGLMFFRNRPQAYGLLPDFGRALPANETRVGADLTLGEASRTQMFWYLLSVSILANAVGTALLLDHVRALHLAGLGRTSAIGLLGVVTVAQVICVLGGGVLVDRYGTRRVGMLGLMLLALAVGSIMAAPALIAGAIYAAALGAGLGILHVVQGAGLAEHFGTRHLGTLRGTTSVFGICGAAAGPLLFAWWSPETGYVVFLAFTAIALGLGGTAVSGPLVRAEAAKL